MESSTTFKSVVFDVLTGFLAIGLLIGSTASLGIGGDLRAVEIGAALLFFLAGLARGAGASGSLWLKGLLVNSGGSVPVIIGWLTGMAFNSPALLVLFLAASVPFTVVGVGTRRLWTLGVRSSAVLLASALFAGFAVLTLASVPPLMRWLST